MHQVPSDIMKEVRVKGTYREMGKQFGNYLTDFHRQFSPNDKQLEFAWKCEEKVRKYAPSILDELEGISESTGVKYESLITTMISPAFLFGCSLVAISGEHTASGNPIYARQMDWLKVDIDALHVIRSEPTEGYNSTGFSFGCCGRYGGQNETGLTIGSVIIPNSTVAVKPGVRMNVAMKWALDNFSTTKETLEYLQKISPTESCAYLIIDGAGTIGRAEADGEGTSIKYHDDGIGAATNFYIIDEMKERDKGFPEDNHVVKYYNRIHRWFEKNKGMITAEMAKEFCSDPINGICQTDEKLEAVTIWSWIAETNPPKLQIAPGMPCETEYQTL